MHTHYQYINGMIRCMAWRISQHCCRCWHSEPNNCYVAPDH